MTTPTPNVVHMETAARLIREAKEERIKRKIEHLMEITPPEVIIKAVSKFSSGADKATAGLNGAAELPRGQTGGGATTPPERPQFPGGIDDLEV